MAKTVRKKAYTDAQIAKGKCVRCGEQAEFQWSACADDNIWRLLCGKCDLELNAIVLRWYNFPDWRAKIVRYATKIGRKFRGLPNITEENVQ